MKFFIIFLFFIFNVFIFSIVVGLLCSANFMLYSNVNQSPPTHFSYIIFHYIPSQETRYSSMCYRGGFHCLSTPNAIFASINPKLSVHPTPSHSPLTTTILFSKYRRFFKTQNYRDKKKISECKS